MDRTQVKIEFKGKHTSWFRANLALMANVAIPQDR